MRVFSKLWHDQICTTRLTEPQLPFQCFISFESRSDGFESRKRSWKDPAAITFIWRHHFQQAFLERIEKVGRVGEAKKEQSSTLQTMKDENVGSLPSRNRRRRRVVEQPSNMQPISSCDYYDDEEEDYKRDRRHEDRIFKGSCSFGQFVVNPCLCLINTAVSCAHRRGLRPNGKIGVLVSSGRRNPRFLLAFALFLVFLRTKFSVLCPEVLVFSPSVPIGRHLSDEALNRMPITIPNFEYKEHDIGGWKHPRRFFYPTVALPVNHSPKERDFGGLKILVTEKRENSIIPDGKGRFVSNNQLLADPRKIHPRDGKIAERRWNRMTKHDPHMHSWAKFPEDLEDVKDDCRYPTFAKKYYPQCNMVHEVALGENFDPTRATKPGYDRSFDMFYISHGAFRDVWVIDQPFPESAKTVLKMNRYKLPWTYETYWNTLNDALVMEKLTGSPRIVDIYAHCGGTVWVEVCNCFESEGCF